MRLQGKVAIVTGGAQGIGRAISETFEREGAKVIAVDMQEATFNSENIKGYALNVTDRNAIVEFFNWAVAEYGKIDILVNNAGITRDGLIHKMTEEMWDMVIDVNLKGVFNMTQVIGPQMMTQGQGSIINIASVVGEYGNVGQTNYAATKAGVIGMAKTWAKEFSRKGAAVRVNSVAPGYVNTEMMKTVPDKVLDPIRAKTMLGRLGEPQEIANACLFLASDEASFITGHNLSVNGGLRL
ncbi:beta-ketoacyl-ACP reductase [Fusibacter ferrireducens]|uniref:Beta-ketoacyl-ACP reductase n=1 Tax=Fusibacter ferrireducens TaxID=2785058 RepID=A0ABR9ZT81_9FIRM|nr:beta-ketoacyl-ACP reductase [Fusibacter ferrireducens]MBF4693647.1 beta-ketoacyl-ACP reductase [Fusibacter ferrireducens]